MAAKNSTKDKQMAAYLKKIGAKRIGGRCPICNKLVSDAYSHIAFHK